MFKLYQLIGKDCETLCTTIGTAAGARRRVSGRRYLNATRPKWREEAGVTAGNIKVAFVTEELEERAGVT